MAGPQGNSPSPLEEKRLISPEEGKLEPLKPGDEEHLLPGEEAEAATKRLDKAYVDKGKGEDARGQKTLAQNVENGKKQD